MLLCPIKLFEAAMTETTSKRGEEGFKKERIKEDAHITPRGKDKAKGKPESEPCTKMMASLYWAPLSDL